MDTRDASTSKKSEKYARHQASSIQESIQGLDTRLNAIFKAVRNCSPDRVVAAGDQQTKGDDHHWSQSKGVMDDKDRGWENSTKKYADSAFAKIEPAVTELRGSVNALYRIIHFSGLTDPNIDVKGGGGDHNWSEETGEMENKDEETLKRVKGYVDGLERKLSTEVAKIVSKIEGMEDITEGWCDLKAEKPDQILHEAS